MLVALVFVTPMAGWAAVPAFADPVAIAGRASASAISSSVIPYVADQMAMARLTRAAYALMVSLLPATATVIGLIVLTQVPSADATRSGIALVIAGVALHREPTPRPAAPPSPPPRPSPAATPTPAVSGSHARP